MSPSTGLRGRIEVTADKSISHRALLLGALANGRTRITNLLESADCVATWRALEALGVRVDREGEVVVVPGVGLRGFSEPTAPIDCGNSGTTLRILSGILAGQAFNALLTGDDSLRRRPMARIMEPLRAMGGVIAGTNGDRPPLRIEGRPLHGADHVLDVASAQVKSCLLLAGLLAEGTTAVTEPAASRDHTERMLRYFGVHIESRGNTHQITGGQELAGRSVWVPGDLSSAAFFVVGALITAGSELTLPSIGVNPTRAGLLDVAKSMGGNIELRSPRDVGGEPVADLAVSTSELHASDIGGAIVPRLIDEIPILAVTATQAHGTTTIRDAAELRVKETDRIAATVGELKKMGAVIEEREDGMVIQGPARLRGAVCDSHGDHRIAMALAIAALVADGETTIADADCIDVSFPGFSGTLAKASTSHEG